MFNVDDQVSVWGGQFVGTVTEVIGGSPTQYRVEGMSPVGSFVVEENDLEAI